MGEVDKTIYNEFEQLMIDSGYRFFKDHWKDSVRGIQKRFEDDKGTKYFITAYHYNFSKQFPERKDIQDKDSYSFTAQFHLDGLGKSQCINIEYSAQFFPNEYWQTTSLEEVETFFEKMFVDSGADYYSTYDNE